MKGRVAVLRAYGGEFDLREYPVPEVEPGAILVKLTRAGVCGSDLHIWRGEMKETYGASPQDLTFGHEMCGRVERLGAGVTMDSMGQPLREGDRVTYLYFFPCGRCPVCFTTRWAIVLARAAPTAWPARRPTSTTRTGTTTISAPVTTYSKSPTRSRTTSPRRATARSPRCSTACAGPGSAPATPWLFRAQAVSASMPWPWRATWAPIGSS